MLIWLRRRRPWQVLVLLGVAVPPALALGLRVWAARYTYEAAAVPPRRVALVYGAGIYRDGRLGRMLADRVAVGAELIDLGRAERLLMSGDNRIVEHDEPGRMRDHALSLGVPAIAIQPDYGGRRTYDSCYRARHIFGLDGVILVTQSFHLPRALLLCRGLGLDAVGVSADRQRYDSWALAWAGSREVLATSLALVDLALGRPAPVMGRPIAIP